MPYFRFDLFKFMLFIGLSVGIPGVYILLRLYGSEKIQRSLDRDEEDLRQLKSSPRKFRNLLLILLAYAVVTSLVTIYFLKFYPRY